MVFGGFFGGGSSSSSNTSNNGTSSPSSSSSTSPDSITFPTSFTSAPTNTTDKVKQYLTAQSNLANARILIQKINNNCFEHCVQDPGASLTGKEQTCLSTCMEKYIDGWNVVSKTYVDRLQKEQAMLGGGMQGLGGSGVGGVTGGIGGGSL